MNTHLGPPDREANLRRIAPELFGAPRRPQRVLYVGLHLRRGLPEHLRAIAAHRAVTVLEVFAGNVEAVLRSAHCGPVIRAVVQADVRQAGRHFRRGAFDFALWWHGPEHVPLAELPAALSGLEDVCTRAVVLACPWGRYDQGPAYGNPYEVHCQPMVPEMFHALGYRTWTEGAVHGRGRSNLLARKDLAVGTALPAGTCAAAARK